MLAIFGIEGRRVFGSQTIGDSPDVLGGVDLVSPGWGLIMGGIGSASLALASASLLLWPPEPTVEHGAPRGDAVK
jgi:hypothetical protein